MMYLRKDAHLAQARIDAESQLLAARYRHDAQEQAKQQARIDAIDAHLLDPSNPPPEMEPPLRAPCRLD